jgi:hypothetical protein
MTSIAVIKNANGSIIDTRGIVIGPITDTNPSIIVKTDANRRITGVDPHITIVNDTQIVDVTGDIDGGTF